MRHGGDWDVGGHCDGPNTDEAAAEQGATHVQDVLGSGAGPEHSGVFEALGNNGFYSLPRRHPEPADAEPANAEYPCPSRDNLSIP